MKLLMLCSLLLLDLSNCQLLGHFGSLELPPNFQYRDPDTVAASLAASRLWERIQNDNRKFGGHFGSFSSFGKSASVPKYQTEYSGVRIGKKLHDSRIFDRFDSNFLEPLTETRSNKPHEEILVEDSTSRLRLFPGEGLPPTAAPLTRPPNRLQNLAEPIEESERAKNSRLGSIFDSHPKSFETKKEIFKDEKISQKHSQKIINDLPGNVQTTNFFPDRQNSAPDIGSQFIIRKESPLKLIRKPAKDVLFGFKETRPVATFFGTLHASG